MNASASAAIDLRIAPGTYFVLIGHFPQLALFELQVVLGRLDEASPQPTTNPHLVRIELTHTPLTTLQSLLGTAIKIYQPLANTSTSPLDLILSYLKDHHHKRIVLSTFSSAARLTDFARSLKQAAREVDLSLGYRLLADPLSSAGITAQEPEFLCLFSSSSPQVLRSCTVQDLDWWSAKDYQRPYVTPHTGMLPPKIARTLVNFALPKPITQKTTILDPFCGVGTVLTEATELGCQVYGSDIDPHMTAKAQKNLDWFNQQPRVTNESSAVFTTADAQRPLNYPVDFFDAIVFEGYLGPPDIKPRQIDNYIKGLEKMYLGVFKHLLPLLKPQGRVVAAVPAFMQGEHVKTLKRLIDRCEKLGYTPLSQPLWYYRPQALVRRHLLIWQKV